MLLLSLRGSLTAVRLSGVWFLLVQVGLCILFFFFFGFQGADSDAEQLSLTEQLMDAALGELSDVARGRPCLLVGDFNVEPTKIPCLAKGISAWLWVDLEAAWALAPGVRPAVTCKRTWESAGGHRRDFMVGCPLTVAAVSSCKVLGDRWIAPHLAVRTLFDCSRWTCSVTQVVLCTPLWPASWLPAVDKSRGSKSVELQRVWEVYDERLQFMSCQDALLLDASLAAGDVSQAWAVWSGAVESALVDAYQFSGGLLPSRVWFWVEVVLLLGLLSLVVIRFVKLVVMLLMLLMLLMSFCIVTLLLLPSLICGGGFKP